MDRHSITASVRSVFSSESRRKTREQDTESIANGSAVRTSRTGSASISGSNVSNTNNSDSEPESDSESEEQSVFSYQRVAKLPATFFRKDLISACCIHSKVHVYATDNGIVHLTSPDGDPLRTVRVHRSSVLDISVDVAGKFVATASIDGTVMIASVTDPSDTVQANFRRPVHAIALNPDYESTRSYISGGTAGQIVLSERGWLKNRSDSVLSQTNSTILALEWTKYGIIWCNDDGITLYDMESRTVRANIPRNTQLPGTNRPNSDGYIPRLYVYGKYVMVSWSTSVFVIDLRSAALQNKIDLPFAVAGAIPFHLSQMAVLAVSGRFASPELKLLSRTNGNEMYADALEMRRVDDARPVIDRRQPDSLLIVNQYRLLAPALESSSTLKPTDLSGSKVDAQLWIVNAKDAIIARERNARDHLNWLIERQKFVEAYQASKSAVRLDVPGSERVQLGLHAAQQQIDSNNFEPAAFILSEILDPNDSTQWLLWSNRFISANRSLVLGDVVPTIPLNGHVHDTILDAAVTAGDSTRLRTWVKTWPLDIYDAPMLAEILERKLNSTPHSSTSLAPMASADDSDLDTSLQVVYADLLLKLGEYVRAAQALVRANSPRSFKVVKHYHLWNEPEILQILGAILVAGDGDLGDGAYVDRLRELIACRSEISPTKVVAQLRTEANHDLLLFGYLSELRLVDETLLSEPPLVDLMIKLYAKYDRQRLLGFLEKFDSYDIDASVEMCRELKLTNELVYLLGALGQSREALDLIVTELGDFDRAVTFARTQDVEIWDELINYAGASPGLVLTLLRCVEISPARVLAMVPADMRIPGLKSALCSVLYDQEASVALHRGALTIVNNESKQWTQSLREKRLAGTLGDPKEAEAQLRSDEMQGVDFNLQRIPLFLEEKHQASVYTSLEAAQATLTSTPTKSLSPLSAKIHFLKQLWTRRPKLHSERPSPALT